MRLLFMYSGTVNTSQSVDELRILVDERERLIAEMSEEATSLRADVEWNEQAASEKKKELGKIESQGLLVTIWSTVKGWMLLLFYAFLGLVCVLFLWRLVAAAEPEMRGLVQGAVLRAGAGGPPLGAECHLRLTNSNDACSLGLECESWSYPTQDYECWTETRSYACGDNSECSEDYMVVGSANPGERPYLRFDTYTQHLVIQNDGNPNGIEIVFFDWVTE